MLSYNVQKLQIDLYSHIIGKFLARNKFEAELAGLHIHYKVNIPPPVGPPTKHFISWAFRKVLRKLPKLKAK